TRRRFTPRPTSRTMPVYSWPSTIGGDQGNSPCVAWTSVPQMPAACTSTTTSPGPATGSGASSRVKRSPPRHVASFIIFNINGGLRAPPKPPDARRAPGDPGRSSRTWWSFGEESSHETQELVEPVVVQPVPRAVHTDDLCVTEVACASVRLGIAGPALRAVHEQ